MHLNAKRQVINKITTIYSKCLLFQQPRSIPFTKHCRNNKQVTFKSPLIASNDDRNVNINN